MSPELKNDETLILETKPHWIGLLVPFIIALLAVILGAYLQGYAFIVTLLSCVFLSYKIVELNAHVWLITNLRVIDESGIFARHTKECPLDKVTNVNCQQTLLGRILGFGEVQIQTASEGAILYSNIRQPREFSDTILQMQEAYKDMQFKYQAQKLAQAMKNEKKPDIANLSNQTDPSATVSPKMAAYLALEKLHELHQKGILTDEEYKEQKRRILDH